MSAIIFWVSLRDRNIFTIVENGESVGRSKWSLLFSHNTDQVGLPNELDKLERGAKVTLMSEGEGM